MNNVYLSESHFDDAINIIHLNYPRCILILDHEYLHEIEDILSLRSIFEEIIKDGRIEEVGRIDFLEGSLGKYSVSERLQLCDSLFKFFLLCLENGDLSDHEFIFDDDDHIEDELESILEVPDSDDKEALDSLFGMLEGSFKDAEHDHFLKDISIIMSENGVSPVHFIETIEGICDDIFHKEGYKKYMQLAPLSEVSNNEADYNLLNECFTMVKYNKYFGDNAKVFNRFIGRELRFIPGPEEWLYFLKDSYLPDGG